MRIHLGDIDELADVDQPARPHGVGLELLLLIHLDVGPARVIVVVAFVVLVREYRNLKNKSYLHPMKTGV